MRLRGSALALAVALGGCASLLSLDELTVDRAGQEGQAGAAGATSSHAVPPGRPGGDARPSGKGKTLTLAARAVFLGTLDPATRANDSVAWRSLGYDVDGLCTTADDLEHGEAAACIPSVVGAAARTLGDGDGCRDNSFGENIAKYIGLFSETFEAEGIAVLEKGGGTMGVTLTDLDEGPDDPYVPGYFYVIAAESNPVRWDGTDRRRVDANALFGADLRQAKLLFANGYVRNNVWVSGEQQTAPGVFTLPLGGVQNLSLRAQSALFTIPLDAAHSRESDLGAAEIVAATNDVKESFRPAIAPYFNCEATLIDFYLKKFDEFSDLALAGSPRFVAPTAPCDAISIGLGLQWSPVAPFDEIIMPVPSSSECRKASGASGAGGSSGARGSPLSAARVGPTPLANPFLLIARYGLTFSAEAVRHSRPARFTHPPILAGGQANSST